MFRKELRDYAVFALFIVGLELFAHPGIAPSVVRSPELLAQVIVTPLLAGASIWIGMAISTGTWNLRAAQSLGLLATVFLAAPSALIALKVIPANYAAFGPRLSRMRDTSCGPQRIWGVFQSSPN